MTDRRRTPRYVLGAPIAADVMPLQDASIERISGNRLVVITASRHDVDDELIVHLPTGGGVASQTARVIANEAVLVAGNVQFRLELALDSPPSVDSTP